MMMDFDDYRDDDLPAKEEPDCGGCYDSRYVHAGRLNRLLLRRTWVQCPSCNPTRLTWLYQRSRLWKIRGCAYRLTHRKAMRTSTGEAPF